MGNRAASTAGTSARSVRSRQALLESVVRRADGLAIAGIDIGQFIRCYYGGLDIADLLERDADELARGAAAHLEFAGTRRPGRLKLRIFNAVVSDAGHSEQAVVEMVNDDMPFLIDSASMAIVEAGFGIELTVHPVFAVSRDARGVVTELQPVSAAGEEIPRESLARFVLQRSLGREERDALKRRLRVALLDVRAAVRDWPRMQERMAAITSGLRDSPPGLPAEVVDESLALLDWLLDDNFTFLGYRYYSVETPAKPTHLVPDMRSSLGILKRPRSGGSRRQMTPAMLKLANSAELLVITKANSRSTVHRPGYLDYIGIKAYDRRGRVVGEHRWLGLFTSSAYSKSPREIPILRRKVRLVFGRSGLDPNSHSGKALMHILETYPRDELVQASVAELVRNTLGVLNLQERRKVRLFTRRDPFDRFVNCLLYVPRDRYNTSVRERIEAILTDAFGAQHIDTVIEVSESVLARLYLTVRLGDEARDKIGLRQLEARIAEAVVTWRDRLEMALVERHGATATQPLISDYLDGFPAGYEEDMDVAQACDDIESIDTVVRNGSDLELKLRQSTHDGSQSLNFKLIRPGGSLPLSRVLPILENFGMRVVSERPYRITAAAGQRVSLQDVQIEPSQPLSDDFAGFATRFVAAFRRALDGQIELDRLDRLILLAGLEWSEVVILRAYSRYIQQSGLPFSRSYMSDVLCAHGTAVRALIAKFEARLRPDVDDATRRRAQASTGIDEALEAVQSLDDDRILRTFDAAIGATLRTNYYAQLARNAVTGHLSFKIDSRLMPGLPAPRPRFEIFVYSPQMEGVHLRAGPVARGGLRWSDRREDYRTEVLGLMKAQIVKNAVIVPTGAKGGFVIKNHDDGDRPQPRVEDCYRNFIRGLLDVTDNIVAGKIVAPVKVRRLDPDDPYLVVAADKGTATFSDTANAVAAEYGFWLGDAFASGGSAGYDHKQMGITARGAWEAVKRHFRELGKDIQTEPFTVAGIGDMAGDVFGNGMLLSRQLRLLAAFNHRHIFLDPDPDPRESFRERQRLFRKSASTWADYRTDRISVGGGVYDRQSKSIELSAASRSILATDARAVTPPELIRLILSMPVELLWNGGIGTYVKAAAESAADVGDRANDAVRIDAGQLRCQVVGEGGNLGLTQAARIEYARAGGRLNTDAIDNSAGVNCSDREVNIKILLESVRQAGRLSAKRRDRVLAEMTREVGEQVLRDNYLQTLAISVAGTYASERLLEYAELLRQLEQSAGLDRNLEALPDEDAIRQRRKTGEGLTRPELSVVISYAKIHLFGELLESGVPEEAWLDADLVSYFPQPLRRYRKQITTHQLRREIIATQLANSIVNRMGPTFVLRTHRDTAADSGAIAKAYSIAREVLDMRALWAEVEALDNKVPASVQYAMLFQGSRMLRQATNWLLERHRDDLRIDYQVDRLGDSVGSLLVLLSDRLKGSARRRLEATAGEYTRLGVPAALATRIAALALAGPALDAAELAEESGTDVAHTAAVYADIGRGLKLNWLRAQIEDLPVTGRWQALARLTLRRDLLAIHRQLAAGRLTEAKAQSPEDAVVAWLSASAPQVRRVREMLQDIQSQRSSDFASLTVAIQAIRELA